MDSGSFFLIMLALICGHPDEGTIMSQISTKPMSQSECMDIVSDNTIQQEYKWDHESGCHTILICIPFTPRKVK